jgi:hypothetical protein
MEYVIHSKSERGFWSNKDGWGCDIADATRFHEEHVKMWPKPNILSAGSDHEWIVVYYSE